jgi:hypothetical protein
MSRRAGRHCAADELRLSLGCQAARRSAAMHAAVLPAPAQVGSWYLRSPHICGMCMLAAAASLTGASAFQIEAQSGTLGQPNLLDCVWPLTLAYDAKAS